MFLQPATSAEIKEQINNGVILLLFLVTLLLEVLTFLWKTLKSIQTKANIILLIHWVVIPEISIPLSQG